MTITLWLQYFHLIMKAAFKTVSATCIHTICYPEYKKQVSCLFKKSSHISSLQIKESGSGHLLVADDDFAVLWFPENLEAFPQHILGHAVWQVVDVKHLAVVLATGKPWQQSGQRTIQTTYRRENWSRRRLGAGRHPEDQYLRPCVHIHAVCI